jgi:hypothetical protein
MNICPELLTVRRKPKNKGDIVTDLIPVCPTSDKIASVNNIVIHFDEAVSVRFLAFHVDNKAYCQKYKIQDAERRLCEKSGMCYVHFYFSLDGYSFKDSEYLVAFLPRFVKCDDLSKLTNELCDVAEWLGIDYINCIVFRHRSTAHGMDDSSHWQKQLNKAVEETKKLSLLHKMEGMIKHIPVSLKDKNLTISKAAPLENINVS